MENNKYINNEFTKSEQLECLKCQIKCLNDPDFSEKFILNGFDRGELNVGDKFITNFLSEIKRRDISQLTREQICKCRVMLVSIIGERRISDFTITLSAIDVLYLRRIAFKSYGLGTDLDKEELMHVLTNIIHKEHKK